MSKVHIAWLLSAVLFVLAGGLGYALLSRTNSELPTVPADNVKVVNGTQIVEIRAKGGYAPRKSRAKAGIPTVLRFTTSGTFDCSSSVSIPSLKVSRLLEPTGTTDIELGVIQVGTVQGTCGMGMYPFEVEFQS